MMLTNTLMYKRYLGGFLFLWGCLSFSSCVGKHDDPELIRIGDFSVTREKFRKSLEKLNSEPTTMTGEEKINTVLDNFINAGLLLNLSRQNQCFNDENYQRELQYYKGILYSKYGKIIKCGLKALPTDINDGHDISAVRNTTLIDYIYIPSSQKQDCKDMQDRMTAGAMTIDLLNSPKLEEWNHSHLRFYTDIPTSSALLPEDILQKIKKIKTGKLSTFQDGPGTYIIRVKKRFAEYGLSPSTGETLLQLKMAEAVEKGDTLMDPYDLDRHSQFNYVLYDRLDLDVLPISHPIVPGDTDPVVIEFLGKKIHETQLKNEVARLPVAIQALFRNKSTCIMAVTNYVLHANAGLPRIMENEKIADVSRMRQLIYNRLKADPLADTVSCLVKLFQQESEKGDAISGPSVPQNNEPRSIPPDRERRTPKRIKDYSWIFDDHQPGRDSLKLNFQEIQKMSFEKAVDVADNEVLASNGKWTLQVGDFRKQLKRLSPISRAELCKNDNGIRAIYYLVQSQGGTYNKAALKINYPLIDRIDLVGDDFDSLMRYKADAALASLQHTVLSEDKIRDIIATMPENKRPVFLHESDNRKNALKKMLLDQFWQDQVRPQELAQIPQFREELKNYENWLLANTYYTKFIYIQPYEVNDEFLDPYIRKACKLLTQERLSAALSGAAQHNCIKVDINLFRALGGNITESVYSGLINKNCH
jgi:hypothetical protein